MILLLAAWIATPLAAALVATARLAWWERGLQPSPRSRWEVARRAGGGTPPALPSEGAPLSAATVLLLRPCAGAEPELDRTLSSLPALGPHRLRVCFITAEAGDPAEPAIQRALSSLRAQGVAAEHRLGPPLGPNRKLSQLVAGIAGAEEEVFLCVDSDVDLEGLPLDALVGPLQTGLAAVWAPPVEVQQRSLGDRLSRAVLGGSLHAFPLLCGIDPAGLVGKCFALRRDALGAIGGLAPLAHHLGEDMELSRRLRAAGFAVGPAGALCRSVVAGRSPSAVRQRLSRWILVIRGQRPALLPSYPLLLAASPLQVGLALVVGEPGLALLALAARAASSVLARRRCGLPLRPEEILLDTLLGDGLLLWAWLRALRSRRLSWRGQPMFVDREGRLRADEG